jgi:uncharacterized protein YukJ
MALQNYGVIKGTALQFKLAGRPNQPHLHLLMDANGAKQDIAINVLSMDGSEILYQIRANFTPFNADALKALPVGRHLCEGNDGVAIDYVRSPDLVQKDQMKELAVEELHMHDDVIALLQKAIDEKAPVYQFGQQFSDSRENTFFGFTPDEGGHDCHMDQGNPKGSHDQDNGTYQDGGLFVEWADGTFSALFIAFQSQSWNTDENGDAV